MCTHGAVKFRWANNKGVIQIAGYCTVCDAFLFWGKKIKGQKQPKQLPLIK
jgi:hypothetical protein